MESHSADSEVLDRVELLGEERVSFGEVPKRGLDPPELSQRDLPLYPGLETPGLFPLLAKMR